MAWAYCSSGCFGDGDRCLSLQNSLVKTDFLHGDGWQSWLRLSHGFWPGLDWKALPGGKGTHLRRFGLGTSLQSMHGFRAGKGSAPCCDAPSSLPCYFLSVPSSGGSLSTTTALCRTGFTSVSTSDLQNTSFMHPSVSPPSSLPSIPQPLLWNACLDCKGK